MFITALAMTLALSPEPVDPNLTQTVESDEQIDRESVVELDSGHVDLGPILTENGWEFLARDDTQPTPVWRDISKVVFRVGEGASMSVPDGDEYSFIQGSQVWVVPQQEIPGVVWLGWNTQHPEVVNSVNGTVSLVFEGHDGPGHFSTFVQSGNFSGPELLWDDAKAESQPISVELNTHTHANWVFTEPGIHHVRINAQATLTDGSTVSDTQVLTFAVGDVSPEEARAALPEATPTAESSEPSEPASQESEAVEREEAQASEQSSTVTVAIIAAVIIAALGGALGVLASRKKKAQGKALENR